MNILIHLVKLEFNLLPHQTDLVVTKQLRGQKPKVQFYKRQMLRANNKLEVTDESNKELKKYLMQKLPFARTLF